MSEGVIILRQRYASALPVIVVEMRYMDAAALRDDSVDDGQRNGYNSTVDMLTRAAMPPRH